ncbi:MAG: hypothetical protein ACLSCV_00525 [Acutalibacteraceae bacterium]
MRIYHWDREFIVIYWIKKRLCLFGYGIFSGCNGGSIYTERHIQNRVLDHLPHYGTSEHYIPYVLSTGIRVNDIRSLIEQSPQNIENINLKTADSALRKRLWNSWH